MTLGQAIIEALESLNGNKLRSGLTVLGIVVGVAATIAMLAVGRGAQDSITGSIGGIGTNLVFVFQGAIDSSIRNPRPITLGDAEAISDPFSAPSVENVAPLLQVNTSVSYGGNETSPEVIGATPGYFSVRNYSLTEGEFFTEEHMLGRASVALIAPQVANKLFERTEGLTGETIRIDGQPFRILGVLASKGGGAFGSEDNRVVIPLTTAQTRLMRRDTPDEIDFMIVQAINAEAVPQAVQEISDILRQRHRTNIGADDFTVFTQEDFLSTASSITGVLTIFLGGVAGISLLVGGIGIMNIMLVSVTERTREIGLRKALGARRQDILIQFLTESSLLSLIGGIIGIFFGWLISFTVGQIAAANEVTFIPVVDLNAIFLATIFSAAIGLFFGIYPANRAAGLEPVEALRYE
jgi:putative ABC transport system permease protein